LPALFAPVSAAGAASESVPARCPPRASARTLCAGCPRSLATAGSSTGRADPRPSRSAPLL
jgi:hypothetical protein